jgi:mono/diheme cytochrome c family protein
LIVLIAIATNALALAKNPDSGRIEFLSRCAECHGDDGKGAGPIAGKLKIRPADLTLIAKKNNGVFLPDAVAEAIDGRSATNPHHSPAMPIWGCRHGPRPGFNKKLYEPKPVESLLDLPCDPEEVIQRRIRDIVEYLGQIQER